MEKIDEAQDPAVPQRQDGTISFVPSMLLNGDNHNTPTDHYHQDMVYIRYVCFTAAPDEGSAVPFRSPDHTWAATGKSNQADNHAGNQQMMLMA
jgi:hypothetical protein